jgi:hypothetical protein
VDFVLPVADRAAARQQLAPTSSLRSGVTRRAKHPVATP